MCRSDYYSCFAIMIFRFAFSSSVNNKRAIRWSKGEECLENDSWCVLLPVVLCASKLFLKVILWAAISVNSSSTLEVSRTTKAVAERSRKVKLEKINMTRLTEWFSKTHEFYYKYSFFTSSSYCSVSKQKKKRHEWMEWSILPKTESFIKRV